VEADVALNRAGHAVAARRAIHRDGARCARRATRRECGVRDAGRVAQVEARRAGVLALAAHTLRVGRSRWWRARLTRSTARRHRLGHARVATAREAGVALELTRRGLAGARRHALRDRVRRHHAGLTTSAAGGDVEVRRAVVAALVEAGGALQPADVAVAGRHRVGRTGAGSAAGATRLGREVRDALTSAAVVARVAGEVAGACCRARRRRVGHSSAVQTAGAARRHGRRRNAAASAEVGGGRARALASHRVADLPARAVGVRLAAEGTHAGACVTVVVRRARAGRLRAHRRKARALAVVAVLAGSTATATPAAISEVGPGVHARAAADREPRSAGDRLATARATTEAAVTHLPAADRAATTRAPAAHRRAALPALTRLAGSAGSALAPVRPAGRDAGARLALPVRVTTASAAGRSAATTNRRRTRQHRHRKDSGEHDEAKEVHEAVPHDKRRRPETCVPSRAHRRKAHGEERLPRVSDRRRAPR